MRFHLSILMGLLLATLPLAARAQSADYAACTLDGDVPPVAERFAVCDRVVEGGQYQGAELAKALRVRGHALRFAGKSDEALRDYDRAILLQPEHSGGYFGRAAIRSMRGDLQGAFAEGNLAVQAAPDAPEPYFLRGEAGIRLGLWAQAEADLTRGLAFGRTTPTYEADILALRGYGRVQYNRSADAEQDLNEAIRRKPGDAFAYRTRGMARLKLQSFERAAADFSRAITLKNEAEDYYNRGMALAYLSLPDRALADFDRALRLAPKDLPGRDKAEADVSNYREAVAAERQRDRQGRYLGPLSLWRVVGMPQNIFGYNTAVVLIRPNYQPPPRAGQPWLALLTEPSFAADDPRIQGVMERLSTGDTSSTMEDLDAAIRAGATADLYVARAKVWARRDAYSAALPGLDRAVVLQPDRADLYLRRGIVALRQDQTRFAIDNFQDALRRDPNNLPAQLNLAVALILADETRRARSDLDRLVRAAPTAEALRIRGALLARLGDYHAALSDLRQALVMQPADSLTLLLRGRTYILAGEATAALADLQKVDPSHVNAGDLGWALGLAQFAAGNYSAAAARFAAMAEKHQSDAHADILAHVAARRAGPVDDLIPDVPKGMEVYGPRAARFLFGGFGSADDVMDIARGSDRAQRPTRVCEATFFVAAWHAVEGRKADALRGFEAARKDCAPDDLLRAAALAEAVRLR